ncbi:MAG: UMP kinase [Candidatus Njordarchaeales archaeon]
MKIVLKIGGSVLFPGYAPEENRFYSWANVICTLVRGGHKVFVVTGGGSIAREYINTLRKLGGSSFEGDLLGIQVARLNAFLLLCACKNSCDVKIYPQVIMSVDDVVKFYEIYDLFFAGGFFPGQSTTGVAAEIGEAIKADVILFATNVDGVYTADPHKKSDAKRISRISVDELISIVKSYRAEAGTYQLIDLSALKIIQRAKILAIVYNGNVPKETLKIVGLLEKKNLEELTKYGSIITP